MKLILIRHGESIGNLNRVIYGFTDYPLTKKGLEQAKEIKNQLQDTEIDEIYSSPLTRAKTIANHILDGRTNTSYAEDQRLKEMNCGIFEGLTEEEARLRYDKEYQLFLTDFKSYIIPKGESYPAFKARVIDFLEEMISKKGNTKVIVSHGGVIREILMHLLDIPYKEVWGYPIHPGCVLEIVKTDTRWIIREFFL